MVNNYSEFFSDKPLVSSYTEFQPLEEVIVGTPYHADTFDSSDKFSQEAKDLLKRAEESGIKTLVILADVPSFGYRPRDIKNGLSMPPKMTLSNLFQRLLLKGYSLSKHE